MNILYTLNDAYVPHLAASVCSLAENNRDADEITFYIASMGIREENKKAISSLCERYSRKVEIIEIGDIRQMLPEGVDTKGFHISVLARLFLAKYLPATCDRIIYLDCDTIIIDSILPFWKVEMGTNILAGVPEPVITKTRKPLLNMPEEADYYNAGVFLFDLKRWRAEKCDETVIRYFCDRFLELVANDQDAINACLCGRIQTVPPKYNYASYNIYYNYKLLKKLAGKAPYVSREVWEDSRKHPAIIHYLGEERPWRKGNTHPYAKEYIKYLSKTDWKENPPEEGWKFYFFCFRIFNFVTKPFPALRYRIIDSLIPAFMRHRAKQNKKKEK